MANRGDLSSGQEVYDANTPSYEIVEVLDVVASEMIAKEEVKERGHTIYEERTVAEMNESYPADDIVVRLKRKDTGREVLWPISRVVTDVSEI